LMVGHVLGMRLIVICYYFDWIRDGEI